MAILSDCTCFTEMGLFGVKREEWLQMLLELPNGIPSHYTFGDVFAAIQPEQLHTGFMEWMGTIRQRVSGEIVAVDGKTIRVSQSVAETNGRSTL